MIALPATAQQPNVLFVVYDDVDVFGDLEPYGGSSSEIPTPFSSSLALDGKKFTNYYSNSAICSPARLGLLSGRYPNQWGVSYTFGDASHRGIPGSAPTLARLFKDELGYSTGAFGKWNAGLNHPDHYPAGVGFETSAIDCTYTFFGNASQFDTSLPVPPGDRDEYGNALFCSAPNVPIPGSDNGATHATVYTVDRALEFIEDTFQTSPGQPPAPGAKPFFAQIWLHAPHVPLHCPPGLSAYCPTLQECDPTDDQPSCDAAEKRELYAAMIRHAETELSRLETDLRNRGEWSDTIVILTSDNGGTQSTQKSGASYRGSKGGIYERSVRTPLLIKGPGATPGTVDEAVIGHDLLITLADHLGASLPSYDGPGTSFADLIWGNGSSWAGASRPLFFELETKPGAGNHPLFSPWLRYAVRKDIGGSTWKSPSRIYTEAMFYLTSTRSASIRTNRIT